MNNAPVVPKQLNKSGPKPLYVAKDVDPVVEKMASEGKSLNQIAVALGINPRTFYVWKAQYPSMEMAVAKGRADGDQKVVLSLLKRTLGYDVEEEVTIVTTDHQGNSTTTVQNKRRHIPASDTAIIFFLKNRLPHEFRDRRELEVTEKPKQPSLLEMIGVLTVEQVQHALQNGGIQNLLTGPSDRPGSEEISPDTE